MTGLGSHRPTFISRHDTATLIRMSKCWSRRLFQVGGSLRLFVPPRWPLPSSSTEKGRFSIGLSRSPSSITV
jgi:hypothetical protein